MRFSKVSISTLVLLFSLLLMLQVGVAQEEPMGAFLIGELEGPTLVTDPAQFPTTFSEAPMLVERVSANELPPVEERLPEVPLVLQPQDEIGQYGGTLRRAFTGPGDHYNARRLINDRPLFFSYDMTEVVPHVAMGYTISEDGRETTLMLRPGLKWSDGDLFDADDFMFWYENLYQNSALVPSPSAAFSINGKQGTLEKIDQYTVVYKFEDPYFTFPEVLAGFVNISGHAIWGFQNMGGFAPIHYLSQFHPDFVDQAELDALATAEGFDSWTSMFSFKADWALNPDLPVLTAWKTVVPANEPVWVLERNPYYWAVDTEGNQLPYIDRVEFNLAEDLEVLNLRAIAGEVDYQARNIDLQKLPLYLENAEQGGYNIHLDPGDNGSNVLIRINLSYHDDEYLGDLFRNVDFRRGLSMGIQRDQINETFFLGLGTPGSPIPSPVNVFYAGDEYRTLWHTYDPEQANALLDSVGLDQRDAEGYRLRADNGERLTIDLTAITGQFSPYPEIGEMLREQLRESVGIDLNIIPTERSLATTQNESNSHQMDLWDNGGTDRLFSPGRNLFPIDAAHAMGPLYGAWYASNGEQGEEPFPDMVDWMAKWRSAPGLTEDERVALGQELWATYVDQVFAIGLVGLSPATLGVRVVNNDLGNVPGRLIVGTDAWTESIGRPETLFFRTRNN